MLKKYDKIILGKNMSYKCLNQYNKITVKITLCYHNFIANNIVKIDFTIL